MRTPQSLPGKAQGEADSSLALRDGDARALHAYDDHGRLVMGRHRHQDMTAEAVAEAVAGHLTAKTSVLVTDSAEQAAALSMRVRADRSPVTTP